MEDVQVKLIETAKTNAKPTKKVTFNEKESKPMTRTTTKKIEPRLKRTTVRKIHKDTKKRITSQDEATTIQRCNGDRPELNSVLSLAERIQTLELETFDSKEAVKTKLETCEATRQRLEEMSSKRVNHRPSRAVFRDVVSLEFDEEALLRVAAEEKEAKVKAVQPTPRPRDLEPNLEDFMSEDELFQPEFARFPMVSVDFAEFKRTVTAPSRSAYNLYRHLLKWEQN